MSWGCPKEIRTQSGLSWDICPNIIRHLIKSIVFASWWYTEFILVIVINVIVNVIVINFVLCLKLTLSGRS